MTDKIDIEETYECFKIICNLSPADIWSSFYQFYFMFRIYTYLGCDKSSDFLANADFGESSSHNSNFSRN